MSFNPTDFLEDKDLKWGPLELTPTDTPLTARDIDLAKGCYDMRLPLADICGKCGAFRMCVGDYVCWGFCSICHEAAVKANGGRPV